MGRKRLPEGDRVIDKLKTVIVNGIPIEIYNKLLEKGKPDIVLLKDIKEKYDK